MIVLCNTVYAPWSITSMYDAIWYIWYICCIGEYYQSFIYVISPIGEYVHSPKSVDLLILWYWEPADAQLAIQILLHRAPWLDSTEGVTINPTFHPIVLECAFSNKQIHTAKNQHEEACKIRRNIERRLEVIDVDDGEEDEAEVGQTFIGATATTSRVTPAPRRHHGPMPGNLNGSFDNARRPVYFAPSAIVGGPRIIQQPQPQHW